MNIPTIIEPIPNARVEAIFPINSWKLPVAESLPIFTALSIVFSLTNANQLSNIDKSRFSENVSIARLILGRA